MPLPHPRAGSSGAQILFYLEVLGPCTQHAIFTRLLDDFRRHGRRLPTQAHLHKLWVDYIQEGWITSKDIGLWVLLKKDETTDDTAVVPFTKTLPDSPIPYHYEDLPDEYLALHDAGLYGPQPIIHTHVPRSSHAEFLSTE